MYVDPIPPDDPPIRWCRSGFVPRHPPLARVGWILLGAAAVMAAIAGVCGMAM